MENNSDMTVEQAITIVDKFASALSKDFFGAKDSELATALHVVSKVALSREIFLTKLRRLEDMIRDFRSAK